MTATDQLAEREQSELTKIYGCLALRIQTQHKTRVRKNGTQCYRAIDETYLVERQNADYLDLVKQDGETYTVSLWTCTCRAFSFCPQPKCCKHIRACMREGLFDPQ